MMSDTQQDDFNVAIIGAGIAGLALAIGLFKNGIPFTLYEEASEHSAIGAGIGFGPNGLQAMDLLEEKFRPRYEAICVGNKSQKDRSVFFEGLVCREGLGIGESWPWIIFADIFCRDKAHRRELLDILTSFIPLECVKFSKRLVNLEDQDDAVVLHFSDHETARASVVVGADGIQSIIRKHVLQSSYPDQVEPVYAHSYAYRAVISMSEANDILGDFTDTAKIYVGNKRNVVTYRVTGGTEFNFLHCVFDPNTPWPLQNEVTQKVTNEEKMADFQGLGIDQRLLQLLEKARPIRWGLFHHLQTSTYYKNRVVLLGDSAHASLPFQAAGAGQGVEDALILSTVLGNVKSTSSAADVGLVLQAALEAYDAIRRPRAQRQAEQSLDAALLLSLQDPNAGTDMDHVLKRMQGDRFDWLWFHDLKEDVQHALDKMQNILRGKAVLTQ